MGVSVPLLLHSVREYRTAVLSCYGTPLCQIPGTLRSDCRVLHTGQVRVDPTRVWYNTVPPHSPSTVNVLTVSDNYQTL